MAFTFLFFKAIFPGDNAFLSYRSTNRNAHGKAAMFAGTRQLRLGAVFQTFPLALLTPRGTQLSGAQTVTS